MGRPLRELVAGGVYHVVARGNRGSSVFRDEPDHDHYLSLLRGATDRFGWNLLLWYLLRYIALNPVEAGLCKRPRDYRWSSYGPALARIGGYVAVNRLCWFLDARQSEQAIDRYRELVEP